MPTTARVFAPAPTLNKNRRRRLGLLLRDAICAGDDDRGGHAAEEAVLKDTAPRYPTGQNGGAKGQNRRAMGASDPGRRPLSLSLTLPLTRPATLSV